MISAAKGFCVKTALSWERGLEFGKCAFSDCGPSILNPIPPYIRNLHSVPAFRKALKMHFCMFALYLYKSMV